MCALNRGLLIAFFALLTSLSPASPSLAANPFTAHQGSPGLPAPAAGQGRFTGTQFALRERMASLFSTLAEEKSAASLVAILALAFAYGLLHAAGPGHRKTIVFSLFLARKARPWEPALAGLLAAVIHALTALALVGILSLLQGAVAQLVQVSEVGIYLEYTTFLLLALLAIVFTIRCILALAGKTRHKEHGGKETKGLWGIIAVSSLVPCPAATMILLFAVYLDLTLYGVFAVLALSLGMSTVIAGSGYLAWFGRSGLFARLKNREGLIERISHSLELVSWLFLLGFSLWAGSPALVLFAR